MLMSTVDWNERGTRSASAKNPLERHRSSPQVSLSGWLSEPTRPILATLASLLAALVLGCASPPPQATFKSTPVETVDAALGSIPAPPALTYVIGVGDEVDIRFPDRADLSQQVKVRPDGRLGLPYIGSVDVLGKTPEELEATIAERLKGINADAIASAEKKYLLGPEDELEIRFSNLSNLNQTVKVRPDGRISLSLVNAVDVQGKTPEEVQEDLVARYRVFLRNPELVVVLRAFSRTRVTSNGRQLVSGLGDMRPSVAVRSVAPQQIFVGGEVLRPGGVTFQPPVTLLQAVLMAGGARATGELRNVVVLRKTDVGAPLVIRRNLASDLEGGVTNDIYLSAFDVVIVPKTSVAAAAETIDQYIFQLLPPLRNTSFGFIYQLNHNGTTTTVQTQP